MQHILKCAMQVLKTKYRVCLLSVKIYTHGLIKKIKLSVIAQ